MRTARAPLSLWAGMASLTSFEHGNDGSTLPVKGAGSKGRVAGRRVQEDAAKGTWYIRNDIIPYY